MKSYKKRAIGNGIIEFAKIENEVYMNEIMEKKKLKEELDRYIEIEHIKRKNSNNIIHGYAEDI